MEFSKVVQSRRSVKSYSPDFTISDEELKTIFGQVVQGPSAFNLQHWKFVVVRGDDAQERLKSVAFGQPQVADAAAAIVVCGKLNAWKDAPKINKHLDGELSERVNGMISGFYDGKEQLCRDEAIRSASLAAMSLMYAATDAGFATGPMIGFDPEGVSEVIGLTDEYFPVILVVIGKQKDDPRGKEPRRPLSEVVKFNTLDGAGLD